MVHNILYTRFTSHWVVPSFFSVQSKYEEKSIFLPWDFLLESSSSHHFALMLLSNIFTLSISWIFFILFIYFYAIVEFNSWFCWRRNLSVSNFTEIFISTTSPFATSIPIIFNLEYSFENICKVITLFLYHLMGEFYFSWVSLKKK